MKIFTLLYFGLFCVLVQDIKHGWRGFIGSIILEHHNVVKMQQCRFSGAAGLN